MSNYSYYCHNAEGSGIVDEACLNQLTKLEIFPTDAHQVSNFSLQWATAA